MSEEEKKEDVKSEAGEEDSKQTQNTYMGREVGQMRRGDYMIHVFVEKARQLKTPDTGILDPMIEVSILNEKKFTSAKDDVTTAATCTWNEHIFFEPKNLEVEDIEEARISLRILDKGLFKDAVVGSYSFDMAYIYFMKQHTMMNQWLAVNNPDSGNFNEVTGYLKISISVTTVGDEQIQLTEQVGPESDKIMMSPSLAPTFYQVKLRIYRAEKLPAMDFAAFGKGSTDAYVKADYMKQKLKTKVMLSKDGAPVDFYQSFWLPVQTPIMTPRLVLSIWDQDTISDEIIGSLLFNLKELIGKKNNIFFWKNIYGAPTGVSGDTTNKMNGNPEGASTWKGRILFHVDAEKVEKPLLKVHDMEEEVRNLAQHMIKPHEYEIICEVGAGIALPSDTKYKVKVTIAEFEMITEKASFQEGTYNRWYKRFDAKTVTFPYQDIYDMGRIYIYLLDGDKPICFHAGSVKDFMNPNPDFQWVPLSPDLAIGKVKDQYKAGYIQLKLSIHDKTKDGPMDWKSQPSWAKQLPKRPASFTVRANIYQCRDLPSADSDGSSDPFIKFHDLSEKQQKTIVIEDNNNPIYYETHELIFEAPDRNSLPPMIFDIFDSDGMLDGDDYLARSVVEFKDAAVSHDDTLPRPKWHKVRMSPKAPECGEVLCSFQVVEQDFNFKTPLKAMDLGETIEKHEFDININVLGLRGLLSVGILPVKKAFIIFNLKSLLPPSEAGVVQNKETQPSAPGSDPTINSIISFPLNLPSDQLFCPRLTCQVYDMVFKGFSQPLIGTFVLPIGDLIFDLREERRTELEAVRTIINEIEKIASGNAPPSYNIQNKKFESLIVQEAEAQLKNEISQQFGSKGDNQKSLLGDVSHMSGSIKRKSTKVGAKNIPEKVDKLNIDKAAALKEVREKEEQDKRQGEMAAERDQEEFRKKNKNALKNVIRPMYQLDTRLNVHREIEAPPNTLFIGLGYDVEPEDKKKHYRRFYKQELELVKEVMSTPTPFMTFEIKKGQSRGASKGFSLFGSSKKTDESGQVSTEQIMGKFKGIITVQTKEEKEKYLKDKHMMLDHLKEHLSEISQKKRGKPLELKMEMMDTAEGRSKFKGDMEELGIAHLDVTKKLADLESDQTLERLLKRIEKCNVRVYIVSAFNLASRDNGGFSDPYLIVSNGRKVYNEREHYLEDEPNPNFNKMFEFSCTFPGAAPVEIRLMDYDLIFGDEEIGRTLIDLEDRYFSPEWQAFMSKPIEFRNLSHESSAMSQGVVKCWVEIIPTALDARNFPVFDISPKPTEHYECRVIIWDTIDLEMMDAEGTSDAFFRAYFDSNKDKETDTHFRCSNGKASFNFRMKFDVEFPMKEYKLTIQGYDRDFFKSNDVIGEYALDLYNLFEDASLARRPMSFNKEWYEAVLKPKGVKIEWKDDSSFWLPLTRIDGETGETKQGGKVRISIDLYQKDKADANKVGDARQDPNHSPFCPPPIGRISFSLNPFKMLGQLVGPALRRKIYCCCCLAACCALIIMLLPLVAGNLISAAITGLFILGQSFDRAELRYQKTKYDQINAELRTFIEEEIPKYNKPVVHVDEEVPNLQLVFIDDNGSDAQTVFADYLPIQMVKQLFKENGFEVQNSDL